MLIALAALANADTTAFCAADKAIYAWSASTERTIEGESGWWHMVHDTNGSGARLADFAVSMHADRVYIYVGAVQWDWESSYSQGTLPEADALAELTANLRTHGIEPWGLWYLNDNTESLRNYERVADLVTATKAFNNAHPGAEFAGLHGDQEPNGTDVYDEYLAMDEIGREAADDAGLSWAVTIKPRWLTQDFDGRPFFEPVVDGVHESTLMDYTTDPERALSQADVILSYADGLGRPVEIAIETGTTDPTPGVSWAPEIAADRDAFFTTIGELHTGFSSHSSYRGLAIHDYAQFYLALNGTDPYHAEGAVPELCPPVDPPDTDLPDDTDIPVDTDRPETDVPADTDVEPPDSDETIAAPCGCRDSGSAIVLLGLLGVLGSVRRRT